jgi:hypothetical protein
MSESFEEIKLLVDRIKKDHQQKLYEMCKKECGNSGFLNLQQLDMIFGENSESNSSANTIANANTIDSSNKESKKEENNMFSLTHEALLKSTVPELKAYAKKYGLKCSGKRDEILNRLILYKNNNSSSFDNKQTGESVVTASEEKPKTTKKPKKSPENKILTKIKKDVSTYEIRKNEHGNYMHNETKLVLDKDSQMVIGVQGEDGKINKLTKTDVENCNKYNFDYTMPDNLEENSNSLKDIKVNELDEEEFNEEELKQEEMSDEDEFEEFYEDE